MQPTQCQFSLQFRVSHRTQCLSRRPHKRRIQLSTHSAMRRLRLLTENTHVQSEITQISQSASKRKPSSRRTDPLPRESYTPHQPPSSFFWSHLTLMLENWSACLNTRYIMYFQGRKRQTLLPYNRPWFNNHSLEWFWALKLRSSHQSPRLMTKCINNISLVKWDNERFETVCNRTEAAQIHIKRHIDHSLKCLGWSDSVGPRESQLKLCMLGITCHGI